MSKQQGILHSRKKYFKVILSVALSFFMLALSACTFFSASTKVESITFNDSTLTIKEGESLTISLTRVTIKPKTATNKKFVVSVDNEAVASVNENTVTGVLAGETSITVTTLDGGKTDSIRLVVVEEEPQQLKIAYSGSLFQETTALSAVTCYPDFGVISTSEKQVSWAVNSNGASYIDTTEQTASKPFSFLPKEVGEFEITASMQSGDVSFFDSIVLRVYEPYIKTPEIVHKSGKLNQEQDSYEAVTFEVLYEDKTTNPKRIIRWFANDDFYFEGKAFVFLPVKAGLFDISVEIDGERFDAFSVVANGSLIPQNLRFEYDNTFPNLFLRWDDTGFDNMGFLVEVRDANGIKMHLNGDDGDISTEREVTKRLFLKNSVDLSEVIGLSSNKNIFNNRFSLRVKTLGDGEWFVLSDFSAPITTRQLDTQAKAFLQAKIYDGHFNLYASDFNEFVHILEHVFFFRDNPIIQENKKLDVAEASAFLEFSVEDAVKVIADAYKSLHITSDVEFNLSFENKILDFTVNFKTDSLPSKTTFGRASGYNGGLFAIRPHINYDTSKKRSELPIDKNHKTLSVSNGEQLYFAAQKGFRPVPTKGSSAESLYNYARDILLQIITNDMTKVQKAHAIYDWIMWQVDYDHAVLGYSNLSDSVKYESYYLESVLGNYYNMAVCDGIAKAYALMCNMEGIECIRVTGLAGAAAKGGHAWNKVKIDGQWYVVDATWGDEIRSFKGQMDKEEKWEMAMHRYFLVTDSQIAQTHVEDDFNSFPKSAKNPYNYYDDDFDFDGQSLDFYINCGEDELESEIERLVGFMIAMKNEANDTKNPNPMYARNALVPGAVKPFSNYIGFDIKVNYSIAWRFNSKNNALVDAFKNADQALAYEINTNYFLLNLSSDDALYITVIIPLQ